MALLVVCNGLDPERFAAPVRELGQGLDVRVWPDVGEPSDIRYALVWKPGDGVLAALPNLDVVFSIGAGVDHVVHDPALQRVPLVRFVDPNMTMRMSEYVVLHVLLHQRRLLDYQELQGQRVWQEYDQPGADEVRVGVMGLGVLGLDAARKLAHLGFQVAGWSRSPKDVPGIETHAGGDGLDRFLARTDILVSLLPLTDTTRGILDGALIAKLAKDGLLPGPVLINAGRGGLQVEADIAAALEAGALWAASLDVFETEPLPEASPLWAHPRVVVTPHNASISDERAVGRYVLAQIARHEAGAPLENIVDVPTGY